MSAAGKIRDKAQLLAGVALGHGAGEPHVAGRRLRDDGRWRAGADDRRASDVRARLGRPAARSRGRARRADRLPRLGAGRAVSIATSTSSATLSAPNRAEYGFIPQSLCLTVAVPVNRPSSPAVSSALIGCRWPASSSSPSTRSPPSAPLDGGRAKLDRRPRAPRRRSSARCWPCRRRRAPGCRRCPPVRGASGVGRQA